MLISERIQIRSVTRAVNQKQRETGVQIQIVSHSTIIINIMLMFEASNVMIMIRKGTVNV